MQKIVEMKFGSHLYGLNTPNSGSVKAGLRDAYDNIPPAALAALKAQWQAEAIDYAISEFSYCGCDGQAWVSELEQYAIKLHAQEAGDV